MKFPGLLIFLPPENHHGTPLGSVNIFLAENESHSYPNMCATFGCGPTVVSKKGGYRQTDGNCSVISRLRSPCVCSVIKNQQRRIGLILSRFILVLDAVHSTGNLPNIYIYNVIYIYIYIYNYYTHLIQVFENGVKEDGMLSSFFNVYEINKLFFSVQLSM